LGVHPDGYTVVNGAVSSLPYLTALDPLLPPPLPSLLLLLLLLSLYIA
jgi:hypothetical protein